MSCDVMTVALIVVPVFVWSMVVSIALARRVEKIEKRLDKIEWWEEP